MRTEARDLARQIVVIAVVVFMLIAALLGVGLFGGTDVSELQDGALSADATVLAPGSPAFSIWSVIYVLMIGYAVWQALPGQRARERQRATGWWIALTAVLNGCWLLAAQFLNLISTVIAIVLLVIALSITIRALVARPSSRWDDVILADATVGLHLGWVTLATVANVTAWLTAEVVPAQSDAAADAWGVAVLVVVALLGAAIAWGTRGRIAPGLAMAWGLVWIGIARTVDEPDSTPVAVTAWIAAAVVLGVPLLLRLTGIRSDRDQKVRANA
ncbi:tryptophan-rich sensory protein [Microbacterium sp. MC2]